MNKLIREDEGWETGHLQKTMTGNDVALLGSIIKKRRRVKKKYKSRMERNGEGNERLLRSKTNVNDKLCEIFNSDESATVSGASDERRKERSRCRQHELKGSRNEIDRPDVMPSCDLDSMGSVGSMGSMGSMGPKGCANEHDNHNSNRLGQNLRDCPRNKTGSSGSPSAARITCSDGSYSRRKYRKHELKCKTPVSADSNAKLNPKLNPIFLWVRQEDTKIVEVLCEDYDYRNRLKLRRTHLGWRAIPKTKCFSQVNIPMSLPKEKPKKTKKFRKGRKNKRGAPRKIQVVKKSENNREECTLTSDSSKVESSSGHGNGNSQRMQPSLNGRPSKRKNFSALDGSNGNGKVGKEEEQERLCQSRDTESKGSLDNRTLCKSNSCEFEFVAEKTADSLPRSASLNLNFKIDVETDFKEHLVESDKSQADNYDDVGGDLPSRKLLEMEMEEKLNEPGIESVVDMTKHDSDLNDADSDELGQLLKVIPDLDLVEENELEEVNEDDWSTPTDLTLPKMAEEETALGAKVPTSLPLSISPLVTVSSSVKSPEPLTAPFPEVTITPVPKPAHQKKTQNNFLENLLSSVQSVKPEECGQRPDESNLLVRSERKLSKHLHESDADFEISNKKLKAEDITLKSLLSKQCPGKSAGSLGFKREERCKSRLQELLIDKSPSDPISQLKEVLSNPFLPVPDPLLVPRARLPALVASPASEIPRLLTMHLDNPEKEKPRLPVTDTDVLEVSLSNLQSLLTGNPQEPGPTSAVSTQDAAKYTNSKSWEIWQRCQNELNSRTLSTGCTNDISNMTTALSQMLWLPYLNQFDFNANRDVVSLMNSMFSNDCQGNTNKLTAPPQININQISQPSPFLTPTSPIDVESQLKTLAMWQEAVALHQNSPGTRACSKAPSTSLADIKTHHMHKRQGWIPCQKEDFNYFSPGIRDKPNRPDPETYKEEFHMNQGKRSMHRNRSEDAAKQPGELRKLKQESPNSCSRRGEKGLGSHHNDAMRACRISERKKAPSKYMSSSVKSLTNWIEGNKIGVENENCADADLWKSPDFTDRISSRLQQFNTQIQRTKVKVEKALDQQNEGTKSKMEKQGSVETPKLKVKNLVDPNMSPPKLLKDVAPEHLPMMVDDRTAIPVEGQAHLWHPLFGSNQTKEQPYNSPWSWTTVTVNGE